MLAIPSLHSAPAAANAASEEKKTAPWRPPPLLRPPPSPLTRTLFLSLDRTLIYTRNRVPVSWWPYDFSVRLTSPEGTDFNLYVVKRPGLDDFLGAAAAYFEIVLFTTALEWCASPVIDQLDPSGDLISHRLYRDSCVVGPNGELIKDLSKMGRDLKRAAIVDDVAERFSKQRMNGIKVAPFYDGDRRRDRELWRVWSVLRMAVRYDDTWTAVAMYHARRRGFLS
ncbi:probable C-terminal domain small phosphatase [Phalaenopsis equestris]|uniref:probable C-terminal domain small phosphatase n=1 Tax=Phalaenopsis equestris TaxID=78828 RepID=UPI0009E1C7A5|nr:probable C-terminal domain small phosphatase [Phalaenopsis equestris]